MPAFMHVVSTAWIDASLEEFEFSVGLGLHADHGRASAAAPLRVVVLGGFDKITPAYAAHLAAGHVRIEDGTALLATWAARLPHISQRLNRYETLCFLRWPVLRDVMRGEAFVHIDLDLFLQPSFLGLTAALAGRSGTIGSPCFVAVSDPAWLDAWCDEIAAFDHDPGATEARLHRSGSAIPGRIGSDQQLLSALLRARALTRGDLGSLLNDYAAFDNPLRPRIRGGAMPIVPGRVDGIDHFGGRPVLFWHMQNNFAQFAGQYLMVESQLRDRPDCPFPRLENSLARPWPTAQGIAFAALRGAIRREHRQQITAGALTLDRILRLVARTPTDFMSRAVATRHFVLRGEGRAMFSAERWWEPGVFA
ncbi:hypothetical protein AAFN86_21665 [Roseomonas sp. CAU 1739]|uniref:hypothetical protein n=1 Tax=Roseomonas sp. CAU 1739 TaxID=3140364 RepID=UPI00325AC47E